ncbi:MAG TPA: PepSY-associated TM helix domain-containing protein [Rhizomicrobium sp.]|nr:PepSY-associated TM helix domain-containing protein [Rhizomicrobium sp.]
MKFATVRSAMFQIHMWVGLILGVLLVVVGLSGSLLVYDDKLTQIFAPVPKATTAGLRLPLAMLADKAREAAAARGITGKAQIVLPEKTGDAAIVRITAAPAGPPPAGGGLQVYLDPVSGQVLGTAPPGSLPVFQFLHELHGRLALARDFGRPLVGWLGVAMCALGISGLILWWPKRGQWKYAFGVRKTATGLRFHRELHAAVGIWIFVAFMAVSFSGVAITFPQTVRGLIAPGSPAPRPAFNLREGPKIEPVAGARPIVPDAALLIAQKQMPGAQVRSVTIPASPTQTYSVAMASRFGTTATFYINPYTSQVAAVRDPANKGGADSFMALQRPMHDGQGNLGPVWEFLVFLSGLVPLLFVITGTIMWLKKRKRRLPMSTLTDDVAEEAA